MNPTRRDQFGATPDYLHIYGTFAFVVAGCQQSASLFYVLLVTTIVPLAK